MERGPDLRHSVGQRPRGRTAIRSRRDTRLTARPGLPILLGGPHATLLGERILREFGCFDVICRFECEPIIAEVVGALLGGRDLDGIGNVLYRRGGDVVATPQQSMPVELQELPEPAFDLYPIREIGLPELALEAGRGCPFECTFCSTAQFFGRKYRVKPGRQLVDEMRTLRGKFGIVRFNLNHDLFGLRAADVVEFCDAVQPERDLVWSCSMRPDIIDRVLADRMRAAGCTHIYFGVESGSPAMQKRIKKRLNVERAFGAISGTMGAGIACTTSFITGFPEESIEDQDATLNYIGRLLMAHPTIVPQLHLLSPEPGTTLAVGGYELKFDGIGPDCRPVPFPDLVRSHPDLFSVFHYYDSGVSRTRAILASATVNELLPLMGPELAVHLCAVRLDGRLSTLVQKLGEIADVEWTPGRVSSQVITLFTAWLSQSNDSLSYLFELWRHRCAAAAGIECRVDALTVGLMDAIRRDPRAPIPRELLGRS